MDKINLRARELLAAEFEEADFPIAARMIREETMRDVTFSACIRAIEKALSPTVNERLVEALKPFANQADCFEGQGDLEAPDFDGHSLLVGDFRKARAAIGVVVEIGVGDREGVGASASGPGSRPTDQAPSGLDATRFDPSRGAK